jgi:hypothetical protein
MIEYARFSETRLRTTKSIVSELATKPKKQIAWTPVIEDNRTLLLHTVFGGIIAAIRSVHSSDSPPSRSR